MLAYPYLAGSIKYSVKAGKNSVERVTILLILEK
jgi:hypothetical protein